MERIWKELVKRKSVIRIYKFFSIKKGKKELQMLLTTKPSF